MNVCMQRRWSDMRAGPKRYLHRIMTFIQPARIQKGIYGIVEMLPPSTPIVHQTQPTMSEFHWSERS